MNDIILKMIDINKGFPGVQALSNAQLEIEKGEVHVLIGENGAGKSTLMKILTGVYQKDSGTILYKNRELSCKNTKEAADVGISIIHQEFNLLPHLTVAQNIFIGREPRLMASGIGKGLLDDKALNENAVKILKQLNLDINPRAKIATLSVAQQQMVEIAKALSTQSEILVLDEPTAALTESEIDDLFKIIHQLKAKGVGLVYISHRMEEFERIADRVTVMRDGRYIGTVKYNETSLDELISMMVGRDLKEKFPKRDVKYGEVVLEVKQMSRGNKVKNVDFSVRSGEILGLAGLMGAGRTELARSIFGAEPYEAGEVYLMGNPVKIKSPLDAIAHGIGYLSEDRKKDGLALTLDVKTNVMMANMKKFTKGIGIVDDKKVKDEADLQVKNLKIKTPHIHQKTKFLSGGNQQKVIIGKWLCRDCKVLIFDEPTRGIDVGAKFEVYSLMNRLAAEGAAIIMISSELPEILGMSDRIMVMHEGRKTGELMIEEATQEKIVHLATGGH